MRKCMHSVREQGGGCTSGSEGSLRWINRTHWRESTCKSNPGSTRARAIQRVRDPEYESMSQCKEETGSRALRQTGNDLGVFNLPSMGLAN